MILYALVCLFMIMSPLQGMPNYFDPKNIISSTNMGDPYWFCSGLTHDMVQSARHFTSMRQEIIGLVDYQAPEFIEHAQAWIKNSRSEKPPKTSEYFIRLSPEEIEEYEKAINLVKNAQRSIQETLSTEKMTMVDREEVTTIIKGKFLIPVNTSQGTATEEVIFGRSPHYDRFPERIKLERYHEEVHTFLLDILKRPKLSSSDSVLTQQALNSFELEFYQTIQQQQYRIGNITPAAEPFLQKLLMLTPQELFPHEKTGASRSLAKDFAQRLKQYIDELDNKSDQKNHNNILIEKVRKHILQAEKAVLKPEKQKTKNQ